MEYRYYRELKHNYLVFEDAGAKEKDRYQYRIAESGRIKRLVPCTERNINGRKYFYYEIGSMQTLRDRYQVGGMNHGQLKDLLSGIRELLENLSEFLMGEEGIVFNGKNIYTDLATGESRFIFCPFFDEQKCFSDFAVELLELVDESDEKATEMVYRLCDLSAGKGDFIYENLTEVLEMDDGHEEVKSSFPRAELVREEISAEADSELYPEDFEEEDDDLPKNSRMKRAGYRLGGKMQLLMALLFAVIVGAMVYIRMNFILTSQENILSIIVMLVSAVTGMVSMVGGVRQMKGMGAPGKEEASEDVPEDEDYEEVGDFGYEEDYPEIEDFSSYKKPLRVTGSFNTEKTAVEYGETVVLDDDGERQMALFSRNLDKTVRIALDALPITIGKMEGCVDKVLKDPSISRMHCRFQRDDNRIFVIDLGSTNGTFRNGVRLSPQEKIYIEEGDEIRIGRVCFDCR